MCVSDIFGEIPSTIQSYYNYNHQKRNSSFTHNYLDNRFIVVLFRRLIEKYSEGHKDLHMVFIDLEKTYHRVRR